MCSFLETHNGECHGFGFLQDYDTSMWSKMCFDMEESRTQKSRQAIQKEHAPDGRLADLKKEAY